LPLGAIDDNRRSLVALDNLVDLILACASHPQAANQTFLAADGEDLSTTELLRRLAAALGTSARLLPVPARVLETAGALLGKRSVIQRLCGSLQVDSSKARELLGWTPPFSVNDGLASTAAAFLQPPSPRAP
jgi:nucleoside-diphosphate-sugar epimerase